MIRHIVFFRVPKGETGAVDDFIPLLERLRDVEVVRFLEIGTDVRHTERSYDVCLAINFKNLEDFDAYYVHPLHQEVLRYQKEHGIQAVMVDYEVRDHGRPLSF